MCWNCSRRTFLNTSLAAGVVTSFPALAQSDDRFVTCAWDPDELGNSSRSSTSHNVELDRAFIAELKRIIQIIPVNPGFQFIEERSPNAAALRKTLVPGTTGTVLIGLKLVNLLMQRQDGGVSIAGVCAHECGHIYQYFSGIFDELHNTLIAELHADFIAGYYMGKRKDVAPDQVKLFAETLLQFGTYDYGNPRFHGDSGQRTAAMTCGYRTAVAGSNFEDAITIGKSYVRQL
jgi:hypothetical protein